MTAGQATTLSDWVNGGGNLIAMKPDSDLSSLLGITSASGTSVDDYLKVDTTTAPGAGIVSDTIQYHGSADRYSLSGAQAIATIYSNATTHDQFAGRHTARCRNQRWSGRRIHFRSGAVGGADQTGQPSLGRQTNATANRRFARTICSSAATCHRLDQSQQGGDSAGRRAAAAPCQPDPGDEPGQEAPAAVLVLPTQH